MSRLPLGFHVRLGSKFERGVTWGGPGRSLRDDAALVELIQGIQELVAKSPQTQMARSYSPRKLGGVFVAKTASSGLYDVSVLLEL